ncbi:hypothetical protein [Dyella amyloliquefaciens]|uniref:hypothetical protein n=1 Tax=Dyella amyloliquefaciens TaxID=1770545 RepID=UPI00102E4D6A|nr:hypothetical protein [Dyella amyloliquefaciens]
MMTVERLQEPQALRLAMGELNASELRIAQAAVRFAHFHLTRAVTQLLAHKVVGSSGDRTTLLSREEAGAQHRARLLGNETWLTESQVDELLSRTRRRRSGEQLRIGRKLAGVPIGDVYLYPIVQFDMAAGDVLSVMEELLAVIPPDTGEWATINWLFEGRRSLDGKCPADFLSSAPTLSVKAAREDFMPSEADW